MDNALAVAHIETIRSNLITFGRHSSSPSSPRGSVAGRTTFVLGFHTISPSIRPTRWILVSVFALDTRIRAHWPSPLHGRQAQPTFPLIRLCALALTDRLTTNRATVPSLVLVTCASAFLFLHLYFAGRSSFRRRIKFARYRFEPLASFSPYDPAVIVARPRLSEFARRFSFL